MENTRYPGKIEHAVARVAGRQHGHVTRQQLLDIGLARSAIQRRIDAGRLIRVHAGVYAVGHLPTTPLAQAAAAVLACGASAVLSHRSAAALWGLQKRWPKPIEVTTPSARRRRGIKAHRSATLARRDTTTHRGIRVTSPARTVYDIAPQLSDKLLTRAVNDALLSNFLNRTDLTEMIDRNPVQQDCERLARELQKTGPTRSELEDAFSALTSKYDLPTPQLNATVNGCEVDALFPAQGVIVELDGWQYHHSRAAFQNDRERDAQMLSTGLPTVRVTWERLKQAPAREAERLKAILTRQELLRSSQIVLE